MKKTLFLTILTVILNIAFIAFSFAIAIFTGYMVDGDGADLLGKRVSKVNKQTIESLKKNTTSGVFK